MTCNYNDIAKSIRCWILDALPDDLGAYRWQDGRTIPAITIIGNRQQQHPPAGVEVSGLEVVIFYPEPDMMPLMGYFQNSDNWAILLKQWDSKSNTLEAKDKLMVTTIYPIVQAIRVNGNVLAGIPESFRLIVQIPHFVGTS